MSLLLKSLRTRFKKLRINSSKKLIKKYKRILDKKITKLKSKILLKFFWIKIMIRIKTGMLIKSILIRLSNKNRYSKNSKQNLSVRMWN